MFNLLCSILVTGCGLGFPPTAVVAAASPKTFNVVTYGAKGDGVADDSGAVERALKAAAAAGGGRVEFPCGEFSIESSQGSAPANRSLLYLKEAGAVQVTGQGACTHVFTLQPRKSVLEFEDSSHIQVSNLRITAVNTVYLETYGMGAGSAVRFSGVRYGAISNLEVDGASAGALYFTKGTSNSSMVGNNIHDTYGSGIWEDDCGSISSSSCAPSRPPANNSYLLNTLTNTSLASQVALSLDDGNASSFAIVKGNIISWTRRMIAGTPFAAQCIQANNTSDASIVNNTCTGTPWNGIVITTGVAGQSKRVTIQGNVIQNSGTSYRGGNGIVIYDDPRGNGISGFNVIHNTITRSSLDGILVEPWQQNHIHDGQVSNNTVQLSDQRSPGSHFGIEVVRSSGIQVTSNTISCDGRCIAAGIRIQSSPSTTPASTANFVTNILGPSLLVQ